MLEPRLGRFLVSGGPNWTRSEIGLRGISISSSVPWISETKTLDVSGPKMQPIEYSGLYYLLIFRDQKFRKLCAYASVLYPQKMDHSDLLESIVSVAIFGMNNNRLVEGSTSRFEGKHLVEQAMKDCLQWVNAIIAHIIYLFSQRAGYAPEYLMMCYEGAGLLRDEEIDALIETHFPGYEGNDTRRRRNYMRNLIKKNIM